MTDPVKDATKNGRAERLAAALRANLRKRKAQARDADASPGGASAPPPHRIPD